MTRLTYRIESLNADLWSRMELRPPRNQHDLRELLRQSLQACGLRLVDEFKLEDIDDDTWWAVEFHNDAGEPEERLIETDMYVARAVDAERLSYETSKVILDMPCWQRLAWAHGVLTKRAEAPRTRNLRLVGSGVWFRSMLLAERPGDREGWTADSHIDGGDA